MKLLDAGACSFDSLFEYADDVPVMALPPPTEPALLSSRAAAGLDPRSPSFEALAKHVKFLQDVMAEVTEVFSEGHPSVERLARALTRYWDACFERRDTRLEVLKLVEGSVLEQAVEPMGRPFIHLVVAELLPKYGDSAPGVAADLYWEARALSLDEAFAGLCDLARRQELLNRL